MEQPGITFERVWKRFSRIERHRALRDLIPSLVRRAVRRARAQAGRILGAQGRLSRDATRRGARHHRPERRRQVHRPQAPDKSPAADRRTCELRGRVGALIEVSAGFHQDLTGRENVVLQGAIMGMKRAEIERKFDEIVEFSGIADFIDTPVRRYSSGMNARLGFSIAAHLEPQVLIVDEVLAVGDFAFQQRAFGPSRRW